MYDLVCSVCSTLYTVYFRAVDVTVKSKAAGLPKPKNNPPAAELDDDMDGETDNTKPVERARCKL